MPNKNQELLEMGLLVTLVLTSASLWWAMYVKPADEFRYQVMECMGHEVSQAAYDRCAKEIRESK